MNNTNSTNDETKATAPEAEEVKENTAPQDAEIVEEEAAAAESAEDAAGQESEPEKKTGWKNRREEKKAEKEKKKEETKQPDLSGALKASEDKYLRLLAEYDNYRKRSQKDKESIYPEAKADAVKAFLPVYDNLARALAQSTEDEAYRKGVEMIMTQFKTTLEKLGVTEIESLGKTFDPNLHNAVMHVEDAEKGESEIVDVFQAGFMLGEKVIRFAMVKVAN